MQRFPTLFGNGPANLQGAIFNKSSETSESIG